MANLKEVKNRIESVTSTQQITSAMKMVAAAKLKRAQDKIVQMRPYSQKLTGILQNVSAGMDDKTESAYSEVRETENVLLVVITSDRGLCGAFNNNVTKAANKLIAEDYSYEAKHDGIHVLPIGKKAYEFFLKQDVHMIDTHYQMFADLSFEKAKVAAEQVLEGFVDRKFDKVELVYNEFKNVATQIIRTEQMLPLESIEIKEEKPIVVEGKVAPKLVTREFLIEPSLEYVINDLIPKSLKIQFFKAVLESNASEHGARMTAMNQATDNAGEMLKALKLTYNRTRQAAITNEILEIVGGAEALASD